MTTLQQSAYAIVSRHFVAAPASLLHSRYEALLSRYGAEHPTVSRMTRLYARREQCDGEAARYATACEQAVSDADWHDAAVAERRAAGEVIELDSQIAALCAQLEARSSLLDLARRTDDRTPARNRMTDTEPEERAPLPQAAVMEPLARVRGRVNYEVTG